MVIEGRFTDINSCCGGYNSISTITKRIMNIVEPIVVTEEVSFGLYFSSIAIDVFRIAEGADARNKKIEEFGINGAKRRMGMGAINNFGSESRKCFLLRSFRSSESPIIITAR